MSEGEAKEPSGALSESASPGMETGVLAAATLERACREHVAAPGEERLGLYLESVRDLARSLGLELAALSKEAGKPSRVTPAADTHLVSAALRAADLANLAACALPELPPESAAYLRIAAAGRLAAAAAQSLALERRTLAPPGDYEARDLRGAEWRAGLAARQVEEALQESA